MVGYVEEGEESSGAAWLISALLKKPTTLHETHFFSLGFLNLWDLFFYISGPAMGVEEEDERCCWTGILAS